jgi:catechol 2,3-dioxygenase-like lactoylglutathione lyase family enzyme
LTNNHQVIEKQTMKDTRRRQERAMTKHLTGARRIHHHAYACWDSEETRHFYEDILGMPLIATIVLEDPVRTDGSMYCHTFFEIADGSVLAFFEHTSLDHPKDLTARSSLHGNVALEVEGDAMVRQFKRKLDAAGVTNVLIDHGVSLSLRFNDPNGLILELMADVPTPLEYGRAWRASAHSDLQQWLYYRQNWWRRLYEGNGSSSVAL